MRVKSVQLKKFKRFDDLTIDLGDSPKKIVALVGPNGCGKSSVFDAFEQILQNHVSANTNAPASYFSKAFYDNSSSTPSYNKSEAIKIIADNGNSNFGPKSFYVRTAYRFTPQLKLNSIEATGDAIADANRPGVSSNLDQRLYKNYANLHGSLISDFYEGSKTGEQVRRELTGHINEMLKNILDIQITSLGNVVEGKGQLFFEKGSSKDFPFENLSSGEKEVVDLLIDLEVKLKHFDDTVFCIDEPELHLNTSIQRNLIKEIAKLIPENCQLWIATHSIGFLRALQEELAGQAQVIDFSEGDYFSSTKTIRPITPSRENWKRIFRTALEDLTGLIAPKRIIYCEGRPDPSQEGSEQGLDGIVYNEIFKHEFPESLFISGGGGDLKKNSELGLLIINKAFDEVELTLLKDRDDLTDGQRNEFCKLINQRMLNRREIENYLFDFDVISKFMIANGQTLDKQKYSVLVENINLQDLKAGQTAQLLKQLTGYSGDLKSFKRDLAAYVTLDTSAYQELKNCIFI